MGICVLANMRVIVGGIPFNLGDCMCSVFSFSACVEKLVRTLAACGATAMCS